MTIQLLTLETLRAQAREAAEQHIPLEEANDHEHGSALWAEFNRAYVGSFRTRALEGRRAAERLYGCPFATETLGSHGV